ncbi:MAG: hypothetical protein ACE5GT_03320 [Rhodospirillales bacterium]
MTVIRTVVPWAITALTAAAVVLPLAACGVKSSPEFPPGASYPRQYPAPGPAAEPKTESKTKPKTGTAPALPTRFPYDYPNRPPSRY